jgi:hypothetical protein
VDDEEHGQVAQQGMLVHLWPSLSSKLRATARAFGRVVS